MRRTTCCRVDGGAWRVCDAFGVSIATVCDRCDRHSVHLGVAQICTVLLSFLPFLLSFSPVLACCLARAVLGSSSPSSLPLLSSPCVACCFVRAHRVPTSSLFSPSSLLLDHPCPGVAHGQRMPLEKVFFLSEAVGTHVHARPPHLQMWSFLCFLCSYL